MFEESLEELFNDLDIDYKKTYQNDIKAYQYNFNINDVDWIFIASNEAKHFMGGARNKPIIVCNDEFMIKTAISHIKHMIEDTLDLDNIERMVQ